MYKVCLYAGGWELVRQEGEASRGAAVRGRGRLRSGRTLERRSRSLRSRSGRALPNDSVGVQKLVGGDQRCSRVTPREMGAGTGRGASLGRLATRVVPCAYRHVREPVGQAREGSGGKSQSDAGAPALLARSARSRSLPLPWLGSGYCLAYDPRGEGLRARRTAHLHVLAQRKNGERGAKRPLIKAGGHGQEQLPEGASPLA